MRGLEARGLEAGATVGPARAPLRGDRAVTEPASAGRPRSWLVVVIPVLAELIVGGYRIASPSFWRDEAATISGSQRPVGEIWALMRNQDAVHGAYYFLMHAVIAAGGKSEPVLRLPSLVAMCAAAGLTAALGRRLALASGLPAPQVIGLAAGLLLTAVPLTTRYAQEARPYALTTLFAALATYLLVRAALAAGPDGQARPAWGWWAGYSAALVLTGLFNLFAVLLAVAHGVSLLAVRWMQRGDSAAGALAEPPAFTGDADNSAPASALSSASEAPATAAPSSPSPALDSVASARAAAAPGGELAAGALSRWLVSCVVAAVLLAPIAIFSASQSTQLSWVTRPDASTLATLARDFSGADLLIPVAAVLGWLGCVAGRRARREGGMTLAVFCLPWLVVPPVALIAASVLHPVYVERYVMFCLPALSLLVAAGLSWLVALTRRSLDKRRPTDRWRRALVWAPATAIVVLIVATLTSPQVQIRQPGARADDLRAVAAVIARHERPGDAVVYLPWDVAVVAMAYPVPFSRLRDIELGMSPDASATLRGLPTTSAVLASRMSRVTRVWAVSWVQPLAGGATGPELVAEQAVAKMRLVGRWRVASVLLSLYAAR